MAGFNYLHNRRGYYYFRIAVPHSLVERFQARELIYSLKTKNLPEAKLRCRSMHEAALWLFRRIEAMPRLTPEEAKTIAQSYFKECLERLSYQLEAVDQYSNAMMKVVKQNDGLAPIAAGVTADAYRFDFLLPDNFKYGNKAAPQEVTGMTLSYKNHFNGDQKRIAEYLLAKHGMDAEEGSLSYKALEKAVARTVTELMRVHNGKAGLDADTEVQDEWFKEAKLSVNATTIQQGSVVNAETPKVSEAHKLFVEESVKNNEGDRTIKRKDAAINIWIEIMGDTPIGAITKQEARTYKTVLMKLPSNMKKRYPDKSIKEVLNLTIPAEQLLNPSTINDYFGKMQSFINWAQNNGYYPEKANPFSGIGLKDKAKKKSKRLSFTDEQLKALFSTPVHLGCQGPKQIQRYKEGDKIIKDAIYWLPLIALYTGARMGEICQLYVVDIKEASGVWVFDFNEEGDDKTLKTDKSRRKVPIHSALIKLGILDYLKTVKHGRLFTDIPMSSDGTYTNAFSKKYSNFLKVFKIKTEKTSFHSFRHTVKDAFLTNTNVPEEFRRAILGHEKGDVHANYGSADTPIKKLHEAIEKLAYPAIKPSSTEGCLSHAYK